MQEIIGQGSPAVVQGRSGALLWLDLTGLKPSRLVALVRKWLWRCNRGRATGAFTSNTAALPPSIFSIFPVAARQW